MIINKQAQELNNIIRKNNPIIYNFLSQKGKAIYFPQKGILAQTEEAKRTKINATIGIATEDDGTPMRLLSVAKNISLDPKETFPYVPSYGKPELRKIWQKMIKQKNPSLKGQISLPVVTGGLTHALSIAGYLFVNPGDKIILTDKYWENYKLIFEKGYGGILNTFNTFKESKLDTESFNQKLAEGKGKKIILLNFPNNPAGYCPTIEEAQKISQIIKEGAEQGNKIIIICDDAYFGFVYKEGVYKESPFSFLSDLHENVLAIKVDGTTKESYAWGFRVGFITYASKGISKKTCQALEIKTAGVVRGSISSASHPSQSLILKSLTSPKYENEKKEKYNLLKSRFNKVQEILKNKKYSKFFSKLPHNSGYFMCIELKDGLDGEQIRKILLNKYNIGIIALGNILRISYSSLNEKDIPTLFENIYNACRNFLKK